MEPGGLQLIAEFGTENLLRFQAKRKVVVNLRCGEGHTGSGSLALPSDSERNGMSASDIIGRSELHTAINELSQFASAEGVLNGQTVAHLAFALESVVSQTAGN